MNRTIIIVVVTLLVIAGLYKYGYHNGWGDRDAEMQAEIAKANEESRSKEQKLTEQLNSNATQLKEANNALDEKSSALDRAIRAGRVRLPAPSCVQASPSPASTSGNSPEKATQPDRKVDSVADESERQTLAAIAAIVAEGDKAIVQLNACIEAYNQVRAQFNVDR
jgi:hypothetical protein